MRPEVFTSALPAAPLRINAPICCLPILSGWCAWRRNSGGMQVVYAGKAHPADEPGKAKIRRVIELAKELRESPLSIVYLENYEWKLGALLTGGVDLWLNTPRRPYEASGTSGMKAALNGVPSLSILDGWWIEGWIEGVTGWAIDDHDDEPGEAKSLYEHLEKTDSAAVLQGHRDNGGGSCGRRLR